jgi:hypothetical protein
MLQINNFSATVADKTILKGLVLLVAGALITSPAIAARKRGAAQVLQTIPARFHGSWNTDTKTCGTPAATEITIGARRVSSWEVTSTVRSVRQHGANEIEVTLLSRDAEESWTARERYRLERPDLLAVFSNGSGQAFDRCPAKK